MLEIGFEEMEALGRALSHGARVKILRMLSMEGALSAGEITARLGLSGGAVTGHIRALTEAGLVRAENINGIHGVRKMIALAQDRLLLSFEAAEKSEDSYAVEIPVGSYAEHEAVPTCGLAGRDGFIGQIDDPRYFDDPAHFSADVLWMMAGSVTYRIPNYIPKGRKLQSIQFVQEISSEAPGVCDDWPSEVRFHACGVYIGSWVSPGDYGDRRGLHNPPWWNDGLNQYGLRKTLSVTAQGTFMDGERISDVCIDALPVVSGQPLTYALSVQRGQKGGGLTIFGKGFGNYGENVMAKISYTGV